MECDLEMSLNTAALHFPHHELFFFFFKRLLLVVGNVERYQFQSLHSQTQVIYSALIMFLMMLTMVDHES